MTIRDSEDALREKAGRGFPETHWETLEGIRCREDSVFNACWSELFRTYHPLAYVYFRRMRVPHEEAKDLAADFFYAAIEKGWFRAAEPERGRFRDLLRTALHRFWVDDVRRLSRRTRHLREALAGGIRPDWDPLERLAGADLPAGEALDRAEAEGVLERGKELAVERARGTRREVYFEVLGRWARAEEEGEGLSYENLAQEFDLQRTDVTNYLHRARNLIRAAVKEVIAAGVHAATPGARDAIVEELYRGYLDVLRR